MRKQITGTESVWAHSFHAARQVACCVGAKIQADTLCTGADSGIHHRFLQAEAIGPWLVWACARIIRGLIREVELLEGGL